MMTSSMSTSAAISKTSVAVRMLLRCKQINAYVNIILRMAGDQIINSLNLPRVSTSMSGSCAPSVSISSSLSLSITSNMSLPKSV